MRRAAGKRGAVAALAVGLCVAASCDPIAPPAGRLAPINACPAHPCEAYDQFGPAPSCVNGVCTVTPAPTNLLLVAALAEDSYLAPGRTYLTTLNHPVLGSEPCALPQDCSPPVCALAQWTVDGSAYLVDPSAAVQAHWDFDNENLGQVPTALPAHATFRPLLGSPPQDAIDLGLPLEPIPSLSVTAQGGIPGPNNSAEIEFRAYMQPLRPGCYERTLEPYSPYVPVFPPEIKPYPPDQAFAISNFDPTAEEGSKPIVPTFEIARPEGLDGWTAYLRNIHTGRVFSNVAPLSGSLDEGVTLLTNHNAAEALTDLELVIAPPAGTALPTAVFAPAGAVGAQELPAREAYPSLPTPVTMSGKVEMPDRLPVAADLVFTAVDITDREGQRFPPNFEFVARATTDPRTGAYSTLLPPGDYQIAVRPTDGQNAVTVVPRTVGGQGNVMTDELLEVDPLVTVKGNALVADGRSLAEATVEVLPTACAPGASSMGMVPSSDASCMPRNAQVSTAADGSFSLAVDQGQYWLRVRPAEGSRLPWVVRELTVGALGVSGLTVTIPAPFSLGMRLTDSTGKPATMQQPAVPNNPVINAVVRVFTDPSAGGPAVELGQSITDAAGNYEMLLAPPPQ